MDFDEMINDMENKGLININKQTSLVNALKFQKILTETIPFKLNASQLDFLLEDSTSRPNESNFRL